MLIKRIIGLAFVLFSTTSAGFTADIMTHDHTGATYHAITLEADISRQDDHDTLSWDLNGWIGGDTNKLWLKSEGQSVDGTVEDAELWTLYSRNVATFWDAQVGLRQDVEPENHTYLVAGITGLAPYFFETDTHLFIREDGVVSLRLRQENELLLTNRLILKPYLEANLNAKTDAAIGLGTGLTDAQVGLQLRYEFNRAFAPYLDLSYERQFGQTADFTKTAGESPQITTFSLGTRLMF